MRLINTKTLELQEFYLERVPRYGILSHTWADEEVSFQDMSTAARTQKKGFSKIIQTCILALADGLEYAWVDTCCIDKSSSAELTESINSMFQWYANATKCYVFLDDLQQYAMDDLFPNSRWFSRGWTLQELLAPRVLEFYDTTWRLIGNKTDWAARISSSTRIPADVILGKVALGSCSVAARMSWAARRETTRIEDTAYCLLGIFDVNMPLVYGEGSKAFRRLQEEIIKRRNDLTIFAWSSPPGQEQQSLGLWADSPAAFANSSRIEPFADDFEDFSATNKGLLLSGDVPLRVVVPVEEGKDRTSERYVLNLGTDRLGGTGASERAEGSVRTNSNSSTGTTTSNSTSTSTTTTTSISTTTSTTADGGIYLRKIGPKIYYRDGHFPLAGFGKNKFIERARLDITDYYILTDPIIATTISRLTFRNRAIHVPPTGPFRLVGQAPETLWDYTDRVFLKPKPYSFIQTRVVLAMLFRGNLSVSVGHALRFLVLADYRESVPTCKLLNMDAAHAPDTLDAVFGEKNKIQSVLWSELLAQAPHVVALTNRLDVRVGNQVYRITASFSKGVVAAVSKELDLFSLVFGVERRPFHPLADKHVNE